MADRARRRAESSKWAREESNPRPIGRGKFIQQKAGKQPRKKSASRSLFRHRAPIL